MAKRIKLTQSYLKRMINEAIDEFKNASTERFNTDPTYRNMIDVNGIEDEDEFLNAVHNHQFNPNYARENGYNDVADKWEEREKKYPEGFVRDQFGNWIDDRGDDDIDESRRKNKVRLTESQLHKIIKKNVKRFLNEGVEDIVAQLSQLEDRICEISREIKRVFFENERKFDDSRYARFVRMGLDNPPYSFGSQGELSDSFDTEKWNEWTGGRGPRFEDELRETYEWFKQLQYLADCEGYGPRAAARGFNVASPIGVFWTKSSEAIRILNKMAELTNIKL